MRRYSGQGRTQAAPAPTSLMQKESPKPLPGLAPTCRAVGLQRRRNGRRRLQSQVRHQRGQQALQAGLVQEAPRSGGPCVVQEAAVQGADDLQGGPGQAG